MGVLTTATFRNNRIQDCPLPTENAKYESRGDFEY